MSDARSLLRAARASSRVDHQYARYTETGRLVCRLCDLPIKSDSAWAAHLRAPDHAKRALREAEQGKTAHGAKKRKAAEDEDADEVEDGRKRFRETTSAEPVRELSEDLDETGDDNKRSAKVPETINSLEADRSDAARVTTEEEDPEWLALQELIRAPDKPNNEPTASTLAAATISVKPMTAEEIAAQAREEQSQQRERRQAEIEDEKEDAELAMLQEFEEMDSLQSRIKRLRQMRESLRNGTNTIRPEDPARNEIEVIKATQMPQDALPLATGNEHNEDDDQDDDNDDDYDDDDWGFGKS